MRGRPRRPVRPLLPASARRPAVVIIVICAMVIAVGGVVAAGNHHGNALDRPVDSWILRHLGGHHRILHDVTNIGQGITLLVLTLALILACLAARRLNGAILSALSLAVASVLTEVVLKPLIGETIGRPAVLSYPSGHTTTAFTLTAVVVVLLVDPPSGRPAPAIRLALAILAVLMGCAVAVSLVGIRYHYFTDTVAGAAVATGTVLGCALLLDLPRIRSWLERPVRSG